jgi:F-type H+-transporting ATPase subunit b
MDFHDPTFWVAVAFVLFVALTLKPLKKAIFGALDGRAEKIRFELDEAARLREEAQKMLAEYKRKQNDASKEAEDLLAHAKVEAERLGKEAEKEMEAALKRREAAALEKIAQAESKALSEVRGQAVDVAIAAAGKLLSDKLDEAKASDLVDHSIEEIKRKLH